MAKYKLEVTAGSDNGVEGSAGGTPSAGGGLKGKVR